MSLKGNLHHVPGTQLLNLINLAQRTGTLTIKGEESVQLSFHRGRLVYASMHNGSRDLPLILWLSGKLSTQQMTTIRRNSRDLTERELAQLLIRTGHLESEDIRQSVIQYMSDTVSEILTWTEGAFDFVGTQSAPKERITVAVDLESMILDGGRFREECSRLQKALPNLDVYLKHADQFNYHVYNIQLTLNEWRVVASSNARNTIRQIAEANRLTAYQIRRIVFGLLRVGLIEIVQPPQLAPAAV